MSLPQNNPTIADVFPELTPEERWEAAHELEEYIKLIIDIHEEICADPERYRRFKALTEEWHRRTLGDETSIEF